MEHTCTSEIPACVTFDDDAKVWTDGACDVRSFDVDNVTCACRGLVGDVALARVFKPPYRDVHYTPLPTQAPSPIPSGVPSPMPSVTYAPTPLPTLPPTSAPSLAPSPSPTALPLAGVRLFGNQTHHVEEGGAGSAITVALQAAPLNDVIIRPMSATGKVWSVPQLVFT